MAPLPNVPLTIVSNTSGKKETKMALGLYGEANYVKVPKPDSPMGYWMVIFDRATLKIVENFMFIENNTIPIRVKPYLGNTDYFYVLTTVSMSASQAPTGALYKWLLSEGAARSLRTVEQAFGAFEDSENETFSYTLVDVFGESESTLDYFNLEAGSLVSVLELQPFEFDSMMMYTPIELK